MRGTNVRVGIGCIRVGLVGRYPLRNLYVLPDARLLSVAGPYTGSGSSSAPASRGWMNCRLIPFSAVI